MQRGSQCSAHIVFHLAVEYALSKDAVVYCSAQPSEYRLSQAVDYICTMELTAIKYAERTATATDEKFFGKWSDFKKGILKETRKKILWKGGSTSTERYSPTTPAVRKGLIRCRLAA